MEILDKNKAGPSPNDRWTGPARKVWFLALLILSVTLLLVSFINQWLPLGIRELERAQAQTQAWESRIAIDPAAEAQWKRAAKFSMKCNFGPDACDGKEPLCDLITSTFIYEGSWVSWKCGKPSYEKWKKAIETEPSCPFPYAYLAFCYKYYKNEAWKEYAVQARDILEMTTRYETKPGVHRAMLEHVNSLWVRANVGQ